MKHLTLILSFYILSISVTPTVVMWYAKLSSEHCGESCSPKSNNEKNNDGCDKQSCCSFFCCLKLPIVLPANYKNSFLSQQELSVKNNFKHKNVFVSLQSFDIWHPPRFI